jgi:hypothetical protein
METYPAHEFGIDREEARVLGVNVCEPSEALDNVFEELRQHLDSDIDFLIDAGPATSSWFPAGLILDLEDFLGRRVEVVTEKALNPDLRDYVLREAIHL